MLTADILNLFQETQKYAYIFEIALEIYGRNLTNSFYQFIPWILSVKLVSDKCHRIPLAISEMDSGNGVVTSGNKTLPELVFAQICVAIVLIPLLWCDKQLKSFLLENNILPILQNHNYKVNFMAADILGTQQQPWYGNLIRHVKLRVEDALGKPGTSKETAS